MTPDELQRHEWRANSQNGEDGIIEALFVRIGVTNRFFVEFGCADARECNTAHLLERGWAGLLMDGGGISCNPKAVVHKEFINAENINGLLDKYRVPPRFDLLSIDIDGNDYWVWRAITRRARVVVIEYNASVLPGERRVIPYDPAFCWTGTDYFGASMRALWELGRHKGYELVYCETAGVNAFFVAKEDLPSEYRAPPLEWVYRPPNYLHRGLRHPPDLSRAMVDPGGLGIRLSPSGDAVRRQ